MVNVGITSRKGNASSIKLITAPTLPVRLQKNDKKHTLTMVPTKHLPILP